MKPSLIPNTLIQAIKTGNCVAFVGSGFSAAANYPGWKDLLCAVANMLWPENGISGQPTLLKILGPQARPTSRELEMAAQFIFDKAEKSESGYFRRLIKEQFDKQGPIPPGMELRLKHLRGIPFRAIVTTNFDPLLVGSPPSPATYRELLRPELSSVWKEESVLASLSQNSSIGNSKALVVQLHGTLQPNDQDSLVFTRSQYRRRLYSNPAYLTVLRSLLATSTVLFLGYSLTDAYLNELRAELVEALTDGKSSMAPLAWAVLEDISDDTIEYFFLHEGLQAIPFDTSDRKDFSGFDKILESIYEQTNPVTRLKNCIKQKKILWLDPNPENNELGRELLLEANGKNGKQLVEVKTPEDAIAQLDTDGHGIELVISHWGHSKSNGEHLLQKISEWRGNGKQVPPVIIFAGDHKYRKKALKLGAADYVTQWDALMSAIEKLLGD